MPDPIKYQPSYSFSGWQANNPTRPLPGPRVDDELANIATSLGETVDALAQIRRSDGGLVNGIVGPDALSAALTLGFRPRGSWAAGIQYNAGDGVFFGGQFYSARVGHTSTAANSPANADFWMFLFSTTDISIPDGSISTAMQAPIPEGRIMGRISAGTGPQEDLTREQARGLLGIDDFMPLGAFRNKIINPNSTVNQRRVFTWTNDVFGPDRWRGHPNGKQQIIEQGNVPAGTYTLSWAGGGTGRINGSSAEASPITVQIPGTGNVSIVVPQGATAVQFEPGGVATPLERRHPQTELILCMYYFQKTFPQLTPPTANQGFDGAAIGTSVGTNICVTWSFPVPMRVVPSLTTFNPANDATPGFRNFANNQTVTATIHSASERCVNAISTSAASNQFHGIHFIASAELSS